MKFNAKLEAIKNYEAGKPIELIVREFGVKAKDVLKLASNENPQGTSKKVIKALKDSAGKAHLYPDDSMYEIKEALATKNGVEPTNLIIGSGSDQVIEFLLHAKADENSAILVAGTTFSMYEIYAAHIGCKVYKTPSKSHNLDEFRAIYNSKKDEISLIFLCIPNNPLGECLNANDVYKFISEISENTLIVIDAAYNEFAAYKDPKKYISPAEISKTKNAIYLGTFSKLYGLGGMRIGYGVANKEIILALSKLRAPFNVTTHALIAANEALKDSEYIEKTLKNNVSEMKKYEKFADENGIKYIPSYANFITFIFEKQNSSEICEALLKKGIILRDLKGYGMNAVRITVGLPSQNKRVFKGLKTVL
ncbi:MAG: histidinol-phosphate transaminase [Campylobacter sp.]|nr:histidinol-phosphate transaminase [Campylobacter sp.]